MNQNIIKALQYIENTGGNCPMSAFLEDHEPIGDRLIANLNANPERLRRYGDGGNMVLTDAGRAAMPYLLFGATVFA